MFSPPLLMLRPATQANTTATNTIKILSFIACPTLSRFAPWKRLLLKVNSTLEMLPPVQVHEEKRLKEDAGSVYFRENDEGGTMNDE
jgi:hypothetical protein